MAYFLGRSAHQSQKNECYRIFPQSLSASRIGTEEILFFYVILSELFLYQYTRKENAQCGNIFILL